MATLYYSVMGEGRGHAARARALVDRLKSSETVPGAGEAGAGGPAARVVLYSSYEALDFLTAAYKDDPAVEVRATQGLRFHYTQGRLDLIKTIRQGLGLWWNLRSVVEQRAQEMRRDKPDLVICDFEPTVPRAAHRCGVPVLSLDHQHFMVAYDLSGLPFGLRAWAWAMSWAVWAFGIGQQKTVVTAFYRPPLRCGFEDVVQVGPILRPAVREARPVVGQHLLAYLRKSTPDRVLEVLAKSKHPVRVYGLGEQPPRGALTFRKIDETTFLEDLASADAVVAASGNQLMGEALFLGKPVLALPERQHHEQRINAHFLAAMGGGVAHELEAFTAEDFADFMERREGFRNRIARSESVFDGLEEATLVIQQMLNRAPAWPKPVAATG